MPFGDISVSIHPARLASVIPDPLSAPKLPRASSPIQNAYLTAGCCTFRPSECVAFPACSILRIYTSAALLTPAGLPWHEATQKMKDSGGLPAL